MRKLKLAFWALLLFQALLGLQEKNTTATQTPLPTCILKGKISGPAGEPLAGVQVAAVPEINQFSDIDTIKVIQSDAEGHFRFVITAGRYGVTASCFHYCAAFRGEVIISAEKPVQVDFQLQRGGIDVTGELWSSKEIQKSGCVAFSRVSQEKGDLFFPEFQAGKFRISLSAGEYYIAAKSADFEVFNEKLTLKTPILDKRIVLESKPTPAPASVVAWIKAQAIPLKSATAGQGFEDMQPIKQVVGNARVVALGEATHGTREFFQLKHRMLEFLVEQMGFTIFAIEANLPEAFAVNDYVLEGKGDPAKSLKGLYFWTWNTEEVLDMIHWMRRYNENPQHVRKVKFYGFDMQTPKVAYAKVKAYCERVDPEGAAFMEQNLALMGADIFDRTKSDEKQKAALQQSTVELLSRLDARKADCIKDSSEAEFSLMRQFARILAQCAEMSRDPQMAENVQWILDHEGPQAKAVLWAHNFHVQLVSRFPGMENMGCVLKKALGTKMVVFGFIFNQGSFQAIDFSPKKEGLIAFEVKPDDRVTLGKALAASGLPLLVLDLHRLPSRGPVAQWFNAYQGIWDSGAAFDLSQQAQYIISLHITRAFDSLIFVEKTSRARPNLSSFYSRFAGSNGEKGKPALENMDFEIGDAGQVPPGWRFANRFGYQALINMESPQQGRACLEIRPPADVMPGYWANVVQTLDATPYRGKHVRLSGWVKATAGIQAGLCLRVEGEHSNPAFQNTLDQSAGSGEWKLATIEIDVAADAQTINIGCLLFGPGSAWFDALNLEIGK